MTNLSSITLERVSYQLPDGSLLFSDIQAQFDTVHTGLVGRNGMGKSILGRILSGVLAPTSGTCTRTATVYYLPQHITITPGQTVAGLAGIAPVIDALARLTAGSSAQSDFDQLADRWDIHAQLDHALDMSHLKHLGANTPTAQLSGGEVMRVALIGAMLSGADTLILDEPTNHLDRDNRAALMDQLAAWPGGLIVISHDRTLLARMARIVELSSLGLRSYGGNYDFYAQAKAQEQAHAQTHLAQRKAVQKRETRLLHEQRAALDKRQAKGKKDAANTNQAKLSLGRQKERSQASGGKVRAQHDAVYDMLKTHVRDAANQVEDTTEIVLFAPDSDQSQPYLIAALEQVRLPYTAPAENTITLAITKAQRIGLIGPNGSGKSTLLRVLAGSLAPVSGQCHHYVKAAYLDQHLRGLHPDQSMIEQLLTVNSTLGESGLRTRLAQIGLSTERVTLPTRLLSGGERLKGALACTLYADVPAQLLLLDEPSNHLDLPSMAALDAMLNQYTGALIVVSHDDVFLAGLQLTDRLEKNTAGWHMSPWGQ